MMFMHEMYNENVEKAMGDILKTAGEDGLKRLKNEHPARKLYLKIKANEREIEMETHAKVKEAFKNA